MAYGSVLTDTVQSSTAATAPVFKDGNGTEVGTLCRAWVSFSSAAAILGSFNVSSVTKVSTGQYKATFTNAMPDANFCSAKSQTGGSNVYIRNDVGDATTYTGVSFYTGAAYTDLSGSIAVFR